MWGQVLCDFTFPHPFLALGMLYVDLKAALEGVFSCTVTPVSQFFPKRVRM